MKESIGGVPIFQLAIIFLLLFTGIMCLTINHSKAFGVKDEIINIIQSDSTNVMSRNELSDQVLEQIQEHITNAGYRVTGKCPSGEWMGYNRQVSRVNWNSNQAVFCVKAVDVASIYENDAVEKCGSKCTVASGEFPDMYYYEVAVFYQLDIPIINNLMNFTLQGSTKTMLSGEE